MRVLFRWLDFSFLLCEETLDDDDDCTTRHLIKEHLIAIHDGNNI